MKRMSRKNFANLAAKAGLGGGSGNSNSNSNSNSTSTSSSNGTTSMPNTTINSNGSTMTRKTWADKIREKLPPLGENEYEVLWERGVLGVIFLESERDGIPYVSKATESCISPEMSTGDVLKYVNVVRSKDHSFSDFFKILATMKKPVLLRFERAVEQTDVLEDENTSSPGTTVIDRRANSARDIGAKETQQTSPTEKVRSNSLTPVEKPSKTLTTRGAFWRTAASKEVPKKTSTSLEQEPVKNAISPLPIPHQPVKRVTSPPSSQESLRRNVTPPTSKVSIENDYRQQIVTNNHDVSPRDVNYQVTASPVDLSPEEIEFEVYWETGPLGVFFGEDRFTHVPVVTRTTTKANPIVQKMVAVNDTLVSANDLRCADYTFEAFFARLQQMNKPVRLVFRRTQGVSHHPYALRDRKPSVTVDSMLSPSVASGGQFEPSQSKRSSTPPPSLPPVVENPHVAEGYGSETPPTSPLRDDWNQKDKCDYDHAVILRREDINGEATIEGDSMPSRSDEIAAPMSDTAPRIMSSDFTPNELFPASDLGRDEQPRRSDPTEELSRPAFTQVETEQIDLNNENSRKPLWDLDEREVQNEGSQPTVVQETKRTTVAEDTELGDNDVFIGDVVADDKIGDFAMGVEVGILADVEMGIVIEENANLPNEETRNGTQESFEDEDKSELGDDNASSENTREESESIAKSNLDIDIDEMDDKVDLPDVDTDEMDAIAQDLDITRDIDGNDMMLSGLSKNKNGSPNAVKISKATINANLAKYKRKSKSYRALAKLPGLSESDSMTIPLVAPNAVNTTVQVRGRTKPRQSMMNTPDSTSYLVKWKETRSIGLQLKEVRYSNAVYPLVTDVCQEPCCELLKHVCVGDIILEINGRNTSLMGVKKTVNFLKTCSKTTLLKFRHGPGYVSQRVSAYV